MKLNEIVVSPRTFGKEMILVSQMPYFQYEDGKRTEKRLGYKYEVVLTERSFEKVSVKIESAEPMFTDEEVAGNPKITFEGLEIGLYQDFRTNQVRLTCKARKAHRA